MRAGTGKVYLLMYRIALCDDEAEALNKTERMLRKYEAEHPGTEFAVDRFESADRLLFMAAKESYMPDLLFMDIYMPEIKGIEAAGKLRSMGSRTRIVFLTTSKEHALEAFGVDAAQYLVKPVAAERLYRLMDRFLEEAEEERRRYLLLRIEGRIQRVPLSDIVYCEAQGKTQCLHLSDGARHLLRMTMAEICGMLSPWREFVRVGVAYIMNLDYIDNLNAQEISLNSGTKINLPRGAYKTLKEQYFRYYCEEN